MSIGQVQLSSTETDQAGYQRTNDSKINEFYGNLSSAVEKSTEGRRGDPIGLTMIPYDDSMSYGMAASYSEASTTEDPVIRVSSNYGGEQRYYDVHVNDVNPRNASQLEMFALSCYLDDQGVTDGGTFGSFSKMKVYGSNAADFGDFSNLQDPLNASIKMDWLLMLQHMAQAYLQNTQTYSQYLDSSGLASSLNTWSDKVSNNQKL